MGTKLQSKRHLSGYCSIWGLDEIVSNDIWSLYHQDKALKNGQHYDSFFPPQLMMDGYLGYDKEKVKQMILDHESTFRHQLQELHRLYGRQRELMNEFEGREVKKHYVKAETLPSSTFSSHISSDDAKTAWHVSHTALLHSLVGRLSTSETFSLPNFRKGKSIPGPYPSIDVGSSEKCEPPNCKSEVLQTRMFDLEIPSDGYTDVEGEKIEAGIGSGSAMSIHEIQHVKDVKSSFRSILNNHNKDDDLRSNLCLKRNDELADLNEPIPLEETSILAFASNLAHANGCSKTSQAELRKVAEFSSSDQNRTESQLRRKLFGVDIFEVNDESIVTDTSVVSCTKKLDSESSTFQDKADVNSRLKEEVANKNGLSLSSQLDAIQLKGSAIVGRNLTNRMMNNDLLSKQSSQKDIRKAFDGLDCLNQKSAKVLMTAKDTSSVFEDDVVPSAEFQNMQNNSQGSFLRCMEMEYGGEQTRTNTTSYHLNLESLQNSCQQFFQKTKTNSLSPQIMTQKQETTLPHPVQEIDCRNIATDKESTIRTTYGFPISNNLSSSKDPSFAGISSKEICITADGDNAGNLVVEKATFEDQPKANELVLEERMNNSLPGLQHHFDLNLSLIEEEAPSAPSLPSSVLKVATTEIDLEAAVILESEVDICHETDIEAELSSDGPKEPHEDLSRVAAEAIVAISLSGAQVTVNGATPEPLEAASGNCLKWFADVVSLCKCDEQSNAADSALTVDDAFTEECIPDGLDYFEFMTLKLEDTKEENYHYHPTILENQDDEETKVTTISRRPRRGQARRGRQRKDFLRDILPSLITLSKHDVTEDFQTFEEMLRASGYTWQSSLVRKSAAKSSRGRRRSGVTTPSLERNACGVPLDQQPVPGELQVQEKTLTGWGKRTRRLPRQRCMNSSPAYQL